MAFKSLITIAALITTHSPAASSFTTHSQSKNGSPVQTSSYRRTSTTTTFMATTTEPKTDTTTTEEAPNPRLSGLANMLDDGTRKSHSLAQNTAFVSGFFKGLGTREAYCTLLTSLYFVYTAMEESFDASDLLAVKSLDDKELRRLGALETDMDYFYGREWRGTISMSKNTKRYVQRVRKVAEEKPYLLVAHQYTRYLGDLFGGRMMGGMAQRSLSLDDGKGVAFYTFDDIPNATDFITDWYTRLNALDLTDGQKEEIIEEANLVFDLNIGILEDLEGSPLRAVWTLTLNTLKDKLGLGSS